MKKNNDKNRRIKFFDWFRKKTPEPPEKRPEPTKTVVPEASVEKENPSAPPKKDMEPHTDEKKIPRYAAESVKDDGNILESVRNTDQLEYPFRKVKYRQNISFEDEGKIFFYRKYIIMDYVTAEDGHDYVRELSAGCYDGANGRPVSYCSETYTGRGVEKRYDWELGFYPLPGKIECAFEERFPPLSENPEYRYPRSDYDNPMKKSVVHKTKDRSADKKTVEKTNGNKESWQPYITMLQTRYPNMNQYLVLRSWGHPTRPGECDGGLALIRTGEIWYFCVDGVFYWDGEDMFKHLCFRLPEDFFDNTTWENFEDKLRAVDQDAGEAIRLLLYREAEDKAEIEKLFTRSPYRTMSKTAYERNFLGQGQRPYSCILETKESVLSIHIETGELTEKTRSIVQEFYASESYDDPISPYEVTHFERAVSYDELPALVEASEDRAAEQYRGMTADNRRDFFDETISTVIC